MRNFRTAAVAAATAATVAFSGTAIASAQEGGNEPAAEAGSSLSSKIGGQTEAYEAENDQVGVDPETGHTTVTGTNLFGSSINDDANPQWAKIWRETTYALIGTAIAGTLIGAYNFAVYQGIIPQHIFDNLLGR